MALLLIAASTAGAELVDRIVAIIDRDVIMLSEAEQAMWLVELRGSDEATIRDVVEQLIEARLIGREVSRFTDAPIPEDDIEARVSQVRASFVSEAAFQELLASRGLSEDELRTELRRQLTVGRYLERRFRALTYVTEDEIGRYFSEQVLPELAGERGPSVEETDQIRRILEERRFNERVEEWIDGLKARARIRRYVW
jgi:peptidyl-prolyl cis-trans isomerase SurA